MQSVEKGPIVIVNFTDTSADAIIVLLSTIEVIRLPSMSLEPPKEFRNRLEGHRTTEKTGYQRDIESDITYQYTPEFLSWLWSICVGPILRRVAEHRMGRATVEKPRIWWIGTGAAGSLPFHAAGHYEYGSLNSSDNCLSQCVSSYTPSIKSLRHARSIALKAKHLAKERSLLVVTMPTTPGQNTLAGVPLEKEAIEAVVEQTWPVKSLTYPAAFQVLEEMSRFGVVHFACMHYLILQIPWQAIFRSRNKKTRERRAWTN